MNLDLTQPLTEIGTRNLSADKGRTAHKADTLTAICEPTVYSTGLEPEVRVPPPLGVRENMLRGI
jgi:hypothetical protein